MSTKAQTGMAIAVAITSTMGPLGCGPNQRVEPERIIDAAAQAAPKVHRLAGEAIDVYERELNRLGPCPDTTYANPGDRNTRTDETRGASRRAPRHGVGAVGSNSCRGARHALETAIAGAREIQQRLTPDQIEERLQPLRDRLASGEAQAWARRATGEDRSAGAWSELAEADERWNQNSWPSVDDGAQLLEETESGFTNTIESIFESIARAAKRLTDSTDGDSNQP